MIKVTFEDPAAGIIFYRVTNEQEYVHKSMSFRVTGGHVTDEGVRQVLVEAWSAGWKPVVKIDAERGSSQAVAEAFAILTGAWLGHDE